MGWEEAISIATRERCGVCQRAVPQQFRETVMCIGCFTSLR